MMVARQGPQLAAKSESDMVFNGRLYDNSMFNHGASSTPYVVMSLDDLTLFHTFILLCYPMPQDLCGDSCMLVLWVPSLPSTFVWLLLAAAGYLQGTRGADTAFRISQCFSLSVWHME